MALCCRSNTDICSNEIIIMYVPNKDLNAELAFLITYPSKVKKLRDESITDTSKIVL
jgi:hypothetical protein